MSAVNDADVAALEERVRRGSETLTAHLGSTAWALRIDLGSLDLNDCHACVLGQLFGEFNLGTYDLKLNTILDEEVPLGFCEPWCAARDDTEVEERYAALTAAWVREIARLQAERLL